MGLNIWLKEDIRNAILAAEEASAATAAILEDMESDPRLLWAYRQGYKAALAVLATALGLDAIAGERRFHTRQIRPLYENAHLNEAGRKP